MDYIQLILSFYLVVYSMNGGVACRVFFPFLLLLCQNSSAVPILMFCFGSSATGRVTLRRCWRCKHACITLPACSWRPAVAPGSYLAAHTQGWGQSPLTPPPLPPPPAAHAPALPTPRPTAHLGVPVAPHPLVRVGHLREATCRVIVPSYATSWPFSSLVNFFHI